MERTARLIPLRVVWRATGRWQAVNSSIHAVGHGPTPQELEPIGQFDTPALSHCVCPYSRGASEILKALVDSQRVIWSKRYVTLRIDTLVARYSSGYYGWGRASTPAGRPFITRVVVIPSNRHDPGRQNPDTTVSNGLLRCNMDRAILPVVPLNCILHLKARSASWSTR